MVRKLMFDGLKIKSLAFASFHTAQLSVRGVKTNDPPRFSLTKLSHLAHRAPKVLVQKFDVRLAFFEPL